MAKQRGESAVTGHVAAAACLATMLQELTPLAQRNGPPTIAYLLDMALMEAKAVADRSPESSDKPL